MKVVYAANNHFVEYLATSIASLLEYNRIETVYLIYKDIKNKNLEKLSKMTKKMGSNLKLIYFDNAQLDSFKITKHFSIETYFRLFIPKLINSDRLIYLDADTLILDSIEDVFNLDLKEYPLSACSESFKKKEKFDSLIMKSQKYFNAGVLILNMRYIKTYKIFDKALSFLQNHQDIIEFLDQDALNAVIDGNFFELSKIYNYQSSIKAKDVVPKIIHFVGDYKPLDFLSKHDYKKQYLKYYKLTPFYKWVPKRFKLKTVYRRIESFIKRKKAI